MDAKGRIFVPAKFREQLGASFVAATVLDKCISLYPNDEWEKLMDQIAEEPLTKRRDIERFYSANAQDVEPDPQGRILLPKNLIRRAGLVKECVVLGVGKRAEIWDRETYDSKEVDMTLDAVEQKLQEMGF